MKKIVGVISAVLLFVGITGGVFASEGFSLQKFMGEKEFYGTAALEVVSQEGDTVEVEVTHQNPYLFLKNEEVLSIKASKFSGNIDDLYLFSSSIEGESVEGYLLVKESVVYLAIIENNAEPTEFFPLGAYKFGK